MFEGRFKFGELVKRFSKNSSCMIPSLTVLKLSRIFTEKYTEEKPLELIKGTFSSSSHFINTSIHLVCRSARIQQSGATKRSGFESAIFQAINQIGHSYLCASYFTLRRIKRKIQRRNWLAKKHKAFVLFQRVFRSGEQIRKVKPMVKLQ